MSVRKKENIMEQKTIEKGQFLDSISGLKVVAIWMIFLIHNQISFFDLHVASRAVEFFFVVSGFLFYYTKHDEELPNTWETSWNVVKKKLVVIYPIYILCAIYYLLISKCDFFVALVNLCMLQPWSNNSDVYFSLNGPSWYIASLVFCYFISPVLKKWVDKMTRHGMCFFAFCITRLVLEIMLVNYPAILSMSVHTSPIIRSFDFVLGMITAKKFVCFLNKSRKSVWIFWGEIFGLISIVMLDNQYGDKLPRTLFVVLFCALVYLFAFGKGAFSYLLSNKVLKKCSLVQLEFYLFHAPVGSFVNIFFRTMFPNLQLNQWVNILIRVVLLFVVISIYRKVFKRKMENRMQKLLNRIG